jgi:AcrR family transcriptional regulator
MVTSTDSARREGNREKLLRAATICLREKGYARTTARDLAAVSGANLASIGYHFGGKEALLNQAVAEGTRAWMSAVEEEAFTGGPAGPRERLRRTLAAIVDRFEEFEPYLRSFVEAFPPALRSQELKESMAAAYQDVRVAGGEMFQRILADGGSLEQGEAQVLAAMVMAMGDGLILQWLLDPANTPTSDQIIDAVDAAARAFAADWDT